jgi:hypothetical protein
MHEGRADSGLLTSALTGQVFVWRTIEVLSQELRQNPLQTRLPKSFVCRKRSSAIQACERSFVLGTVFALDSVIEKSATYRAA